MKNVAMYTVMIASPSDVQAERSATEEVIRKYNAEVRFLKHQHRLETGRWELDAALGIADDAQDLIDKDVTDTADFVVGIFYTKLGTSSGKDASYTIGELKKCAEANKPVLILFNTADIPRSANYKEVQKVDDFRQHPEKYLGQSALYATYKGVGEFAEVFRNQITKVMNQILSMGSGEVELSKGTITNLDVIMARTDILLAQKITRTSQSFILWKSLVENYLKNMYGDNPDIWEAFSKISFSKGSLSECAEEDACHKGLETAKVFLALLYGQ